MFCVACISSQNITSIILSEKKLVRRTPIFTAIIPFVVANFDTIVGVISLIFSIASMIISETKPKDNTYNETKLKLLRYKIGK